MPWILCGPGLPPLRMGESFGSTATICTPGLRSLSTWPTPVMVPPVPTPATKMSTLPSVSRPDFLGRGRAVDLRVGLVGELLGPDGVLGVGHDLLGLLDRAAHALGAGRQHDLGAERAEQHAALVAHGLGHGQDDLVAAGRADHGQGDAGVAAGAFDDGAAGLERTGLLGRVDDRDADAVLHAVGRVVELELDRHGGVEAFGSRFSRTSGVPPTSWVTSS